jgi:dipeptidyl aminopeptidase/acylaminoacyl peptidase
VARIDATTVAVEKLTSGPRVVSAMSPNSNGSLAVVMSTATDIAEVYALENGAFRRITRQNDPWFSQLQLATTEGFTCKSGDGTVVNGLVVKPAGFVTGQRYPTLLLIHGGPNGQDAFSFSFDREFFAAHGYVVLAVNYRGGSGRGAAYQRAIFADWGNKEVMDLLAGVDDAVASGVADPDRLGIGGWSYGGILTDYTIASDGRFKAAISGASSALQLTMYGTDQYIAQYNNEMGPPWKNPDVWLKVSYPFFHADRIRTPTLFLCGLVDFNVPIAGVEQMYQALRGMNVDTQLIVYPGQHHAITMPSYVRDRLTRYLAWWDKHLATPKRTTITRCPKSAHAPRAQNPAS